MPAEIGGCALHLDDAFFRAWASAGGYHLQIDSRAQAGYDATGLGRIHRLGVPREIALNTPIPDDPAFAMSLPAAPRPVAIGPGWLTPDGWRWLSELTRDDAHEVTVRAIERADAVELRVRYKAVAGAPEGMVRERYGLSARGLRYEARVPGAERVALQAPLIETDGEARSRIELTDAGASASYCGHCCEVSVERAEEGRIEPWGAPNRNGVYRVAVFEVSGEEIACTITLE
jgi:hypothetical protein